MNTEVWATLSCWGYLKNLYDAFVSVVDLNSPPPPFYFHFKVGFVFAFIFAGRC